MYELKHVSLKSSARVTSFIGVVLYVIFAIISLATGSTAFGTGAVSLVIGVVLFGAFGAVLGAVLGWAYNFSARRWGGFHLDFKLLDDDDGQPAASEEKK
ncbi:MAG: hypothetical protein U1C18_02885 [Patescibacteria group bacterium]|nr:hypothetical protein [Patescibacteria group bacterium]